MNRTGLLVIFVLSVLAATRVDADHIFGGIPLDDVMYAAQYHNLCESKLTTNKLAAMMLPPTWWETTGATDRPPSPMTLSRHDPAITFFPDGHAGNNDPHRRAFWHPGIGAWQLDDSGMGTDLSIEKFNTRGGAIRAAEVISEQFCRTQSLHDVYRPWFACDVEERCIDTFDQIYNPDEPPFVERDNTIQSEGGAQVRVCRFSGNTTPFPCAYINPAFAQGYTGWTSNPNATIPLAKPFYVYQEEEENQFEQEEVDQFEWRYWMTEDTGFGTDYAARRTYGVNSRDGLDWSLNAEVEDEALCDVTMNRGACPSTSALSQLKYNGSALDVGTHINQGSVILRATVNSNRGKPIRVEFEVRKIPEVFTGAANYIGQFGISGSRSKCVAGLTVGQYRWRARAVEDNGARGPWTSFGNNSDSVPDFEVDQANSCVVCTASASLVGAALETTGECGSEPLLATLSASPSSGGVPLNDVSLTGAAGGTATGPINYTFYCNRPDNGINITPGYAKQFTGISANPKTVVGICDYVSPGTYTAKVIIERGSEKAEARRIITVAASSVPVPQVTTLAVTSLTQASVTFNATVHPQNSTTTYWFDYGTTTSTSQSTPSQTLVSATSQSAVSISQGGLSCGQQYYYRVRATNAGGSATPGDVLSFVTDTCGSGGSGTIQLVADPSFEAGDGDWWVSNGDFYIDDEFNNPHIGDFYAYLSNPDGSRGNNLSGGIISPPITIPENASDADLRIWYSITSDETTTTTVFDKVDVYLIRPPNQLNLITTISNLDENGTSYDRESQDLSSSFYGDTVQIFFVGSTDGSLPTVFRIDDVTLEVDVPSGSAPTVTTEAADQITASSARLNMTVDPNGGTTIVWFELEAEDPSPNDETEHLSVGSGSQSEDVSISVFNLDCDTRYYFRANAQNEHGSDQGASVRSFTTLACAGSAPHADTDPAENITETSATLTADVDPNGLSTQAWFEWGDTPSLGQETPHFTVGSGTGNIDFSQTISGLSCGTTYYFENHAQNSAGHDDGTTLSFETPGCELPTPHEGLLLFVSRQGCNGTQPTFVLRWTLPQDSGPVFTVRKQGGGYSSVTDTTVTGPEHVLSQGLTPGSSYRFYVEGTVGGIPQVSNTATIYVLSDECRLPVGQGDLPHPPASGAEKPYCENGTVKLQIYWTPVIGATTYSVVRTAEHGNQSFSQLTNTSMIDSGLTPGDVVDYQVRAVNSAGTRSGWPFSVSIPGDICGSGAPGLFEASFVGGPTCGDNQLGQITVSWTPSSGANFLYKRFEFDNEYISAWGSTDGPGIGYQRTMRNLRPGSVFSLILRSETSSPPVSYRTTRPISVYIPLDVCTSAQLKPSIGNSAALYEGQLQALLSSTVTPNRSDTQFHFEYGQGGTLNSTTPNRLAGNGTQGLPVGEAISDLSCGSTYLYRLVATNSNGTTVGPEQSFVFDSSLCRPIVETLQADQITEHSMRFRGTVNANGLPTEASFQWGPSDHLGHITTPRSIGSLAQNVEFTELVTGLRCGTTYHVRIAAENAKGSVSGWALQFPTPPCNAAFTASPLAGIAPLNVAFSDTSVGSPTGWLWTFGDGASSTLRHPTHTFREPGVYTVRLTATGTTSSSIVKTGLVRVTAPSEAEIPATVNIPQIGVPLPPGIARIVAPISTEDFGARIAIGDISGSGGASIAIGAPYANLPSRPGAGRATLVHPTELPGPAEVVELSHVFHGTVLGRNAGDLLSESLAVGDLNADGLTDLAIAAYLAEPAGVTDQGEVTIIYGNPNLVNIGEIDMAASPPSGIRITSVRGDDAGEFFAGSLAIGDVTGDGISDLVIGSHGATPPLGPERAGEVFVLHGNPLLYTTDFVQLATLGDYWLFDVTWIAGEYQFGGLGSEVAIGDVNGDGIRDVIASAPAANPNGREYAGVVYIFRGSKSWTDTDSYYLAKRAPSIGVVRIEGPFEGTGVGSKLAAGDLNGDGFDDLVILPSTTINEVSGWIVLGSVDLSNRTRIDLQTENVITILSSGAEFYSDVLVDDVTGDGIDDLILGVSVFEFPDLLGRVAVMVGGSHFVPGADIWIDRGVKGRASMIRSADFIGDGFGQSLKTIDSDGNGSKEIVIGANILPPGSNAGHSGSVFIVHPDKLRPNGLIFRDGFESGNTTAWQ